MISPKYFIPNSLTAFNLILGVFAILNVISGSANDYALIMASSWLIVLASIFDGLDGKVARMTNSQSDFGVEFDSIADLCAFVLAPAFVAYKVLCVGGDNLKPISMLAISVYILGGAIRLARFNITQGGETKKGKFFGLPTPAAAGNILAILLFFGHYYKNDVNYSILLPLLLGVLFFSGILMVSNVSYDNIMTMFRLPSKKMYFRGKYSYSLIVFIIFMFISIITKNFPYFIIVSIIFYHVKSWIVITYSVINKNKINKVI